MEELELVCFQGQHVSKNRQHFLILGRNIGRK